MAATNSPFKLRILVIDNDPTFLACFSESLQLLKHEVLTCRNPIRGLSTLRVRKNYYDLVMTNIHLPHMDGFEVIKRVREEFKLPLIVVSGDDRLDVARKALQLGAAHYLVKPVRFNNLNNLLQFVNQGDKGKETSFLGEKGSASAQEANKAPGKKNIAWTSQIHAQFLEAIRCIGAENATPKSILEFMNVEGLSTETVAVQLQKYLFFVRRVVAANNLSIRERTNLNNLKVAANSLSIGQRTNLIDLNVAANNLSIEKKSKIDLNIEVDNLSIDLNLSPTNDNQTSGSTYNPQLMIDLNQMPPSDGNEYSLVGLGGCVPFYPVQQKQKYVKVEESSNSRSNITAVDFDDVESYLDQSDEDIDEEHKGDFADLEFDWVDAREAFKNLCLEDELSSSWVKVLRDN